MPRSAGARVAIPSRDAAVSAWHDGFEQPAACLRRRFSGPAGCGRDGMSERVSGW